MQGQLMTELGPELLAANDDNAGRIGRALAKKAAKGAKELKVYTKKSGMDG